jgi:tight adherence protein B
MTQAPIIVILVLLLLCSMTLVLDTRSRRMEQRVASALRMASPTNKAPTFVRVRQDHGTTLGTLIHRLFNYDPRAVYMWPLPYTMFAGISVAIAILYGGYFIDHSNSYTMGAAGVAGWLVIRGLLAWQQRRYLNRLFQQLPDVVELVTSTVKAGLPVTEAFRTVARELPEPSAKQFTLVCNDIALGKTPQDAVDGIYLRTRLAEYGMFAVTLGVQMKAGGRLTETLQTLAETVRQRVALNARAKALAGEVIFSAKALSAAPFAIGGFLYLINHELLDLLFTDPRGRMLLAGALASDVFGTVVIWWMVRRGTQL